MKLVQYTVWVPRPLKTALKRLAKREGKTLSALTRPALEKLADTNSTGGKTDAK